MWFLARGTEYCTSVVHFRVQVHRANTREKLHFFRTILEKNYFLEFYESDGNFKKCKKTATKFCTTKIFCLQFNLLYQKCEILLFKKVLKKTQFLVDEFQRKALLHPLWSKYINGSNFMIIARSWPLRQYFFSFKNSFFHTENGRWKLLVRGGPNLPKSTLRFCPIGVKTKQLSSNRSLYISLNV